MTLLGISPAPTGAGGFSLGVSAAPTIDVSLDEMIKNRTRETHQVRQTVVRRSKRNEKINAKRGLTKATTNSMDIDQQVQTEMNTRAVKKANQVMKAAKGKPKKKTTVAQAKVIRKIQQDGKEAAKSLKKQQQQKKVAVIPTKKAIKAARTALIQNGVEIPKGYQIQLVPAAAAATKPTKQQPAPKKQAGTQKKSNAQQTKKPANKRNTQKR